MVEFARREAASWTVLLRPSPSSTTYLPAWNKIRIGVLTVLWLSPGRAPCAMPKTLNSAGRVAPGFFAPGGRSVRIALQAENLTVECHVVKGIPNHACRPGDDELTARAMTSSIPE
jgi:hypothetical protein